MSAVYFIAADENGSLIEKLDTLLERAGIPEIQRRLLVIDRSKFFGTIK